MSEKEIEMIEDIDLQDELVESVEVSDEELAEKHNPETAEKDSVASVDAAGDVTSQQPKRTGDKSNAEAMPKTKAAILQAAFDKMSKMKKGDMQKAYEAMCEGTYEEDAQAVVESNFDEDLTALVESEATLSEGFKGKAAVIFEAALKSKLSEHVERLEEQYAEELSEEVARVESELVEKVDGYLNYVVEQWMDDNKLAIESGLRTEIAESFMSQLHAVFTEHYIEVPESKVDLVDELATKVEELEEQVSTHVDANIELKESVKALTREAIIRESATGLSETQAEKLKSLVEDIDFDTAESFEEKVSTIKESYFKETKADVISEDVAVESEGAEEIEVSPMMQRYLDALKIK
jgi:hypothetical protein